MNSWKKTFDKWLSYIGKGNFTQLSSFGYTLLDFYKIGTWKILQTEHKIGNNTMIAFSSFCPEAKMHSMQSIKQNNDATLLVE